jgi:uncharacterized protein YndB with AHSA1/START domain
MALLALCTAGEPLLAQHPAAAPGDVRMDDLAWLAGAWRGPGPEGRGTAEIHFMTPEAGVMPSIFRLTEGDRVAVLEAITLVEEGEGLVMYVRHFDPALVPYEEGEALALRLTGREGDAFVFENVRAGANPVRSVLTPTRAGFASTSELAGPDGSTSEIRVEYERVGGGPTEGPSYSDDRLDEGVLEWSIVLDVPVQRAWDAFTDEEAMEGWMAPAVETDFRIGGLVRSNYDPEAGVGGPGTIESEILAYEPGRMLAMRTVTVPENAPQAKAILDAWSVTYFEPLGPRRALVTLRSLGWGEGPEWDRAREFFAEGNLYVLRELRAYLEEGSG